MGAVSRTQPAHAGAPNQIGTPCEASQYIERTHPIQVHGCLTLAAPADVH